MLTEAELQKKWESLTFTDNFIFSRVMHDEHICRQVVELILGVRIGKIRYLSAQDEHKTDPDSMRIIMDVFLRDENRIINVEVQTGHKKELPKRSRYYQSVADVSTTSTGTNIGIYQKTSSFSSVLLTLLTEIILVIPLNTSVTRIKGSN